MIANVNPRGHSFQGVTAYLLHDKGAQTSERVLWTGTRNLHTEDVEKAAAFMAWTDQNRLALRRAAGGASSGRKASEGRVYHYSLSWEPGSEIDRVAMEKAAEDTAQRLGLSEHQYYLVAHSDTDHRHVHVVANLVHPETGRIASNYRDRNVLDRWAHEYEQAHGIRCEQRAKKYEKRERGEPAFEQKPRRSETKQAVSEAFHCSDSGQAFTAALQEQGLTLAQGSRRSFVVVDQDGSVYALNRMVELSDGTTGRAKGKAITARLADLDRGALPTADAIAAERQSYDRDAAEIERQKALAEASDEAGKAKAAELAAKDAARRAAALRERQVKWRALQRSIDEKTVRSRSKWQIDALTRKVEAARSDVEAYSGFWSKIFRRKQIAEAKDRLADYEQRLDERTTRFRADVEAFNAERPAWIRERELQRHGLTAPKSEGGGRSSPSPPPPGVRPEDAEAKRQADLELLARARERQRRQQRDRPGPGYDGPERGP